MDFRIYHVCFKRVINKIVQLSMRLKNAENSANFIAGHNKDTNKPHISIVEYLKLNRESYSIYYPNIDNDKKEKHYYLYCVLTKCLNIFKT